MVPLIYINKLTFVYVQSDKYGNNKILEEYDGVNCIFLQNTGFLRASFQENTESDAICFPDPCTEFIRDHKSRLEGMYILAPFEDIDNDEAWYKVTSVTINKAHLLDDMVDNIELLLKKTRKPYAIS